MFFKRKTNYGHLKVNIPNVKTAGVSSSSQLTDMFTKVLGELTIILGMHDLYASLKGEC